MERVAGRIDATLDYFSIDLLLKTLVAPFRQISAGPVRGSLDLRIHAFFDRLISRGIGLVVRLVMIVVGAGVIVGNVIIGGVFLIAWMFVPLLPLIGLLLYATEWLPWAT